MGLVGRVLPSGATGFGPGRVSQISTMYSRGSTGNIVALGRGGSPEWTAPIGDHSDTERSPFPLSSDANTPNEVHFDLTTDPAGTVPLSADFLLGEKFSAAGKLCLASRRARHAPPPGRVALQPLFKPRGGCGRRRIYRDLTLYSKQRWSHRTLLLSPFFDNDRYYVSTATRNSCYGCSTRRHNLVVSCHVLCTRHRDTSHTHLVLLLGTRSPALGCAGLGTE